MTFFDDFHDFFMTLFFMSLRNHRRPFLFVVFRPDPTYTKISGVAKDTCFGVSGASTSKKMLGVSPSVRFFGVATSRVRLVTSRSRLELASARP